MSRTKARREIATKQIRIYPGTLKSLQGLSILKGQTIARVIDELVKTA